MSRAPITTTQAKPALRFTVWVNSNDEESLCVEITAESHAQAATEGLRRWMLSGNATHDAGELIVTTNLKLVPQRCA